MILILFNYTIHQTIGYVLQLHLLQVECHIIIYNIKIIFDYYEIF